MRTVCKSPHRDQGALHSDTGLRNIYHVASSSAAIARIKAESLQTAGFAVGTKARLGLAWIANTEQMDGG